MSLSITGEVWVVHDGPNHGCTVYGVFTEYNVADGFVADLCQKLGREWTTIEISGLELDTGQHYDRDRMRGT